MVNFLPFPSLTFYLFFSRNPEIGSEKKGFLNFLPFYEHSEGNWSTFSKNSNLVFFPKTVNSGARKSVSSRKFDHSKGILEKTCDTLVLKTFGYSEIFYMQVLSLKNFQPYCPYYLSQKNGFPSKGFLKSFWQWLFSDIFLHIRNMVWQKFSYLPVQKFLLMVFGTF